MDGPFKRNLAGRQANPLDQLTHIEFYKNIHQKCFAENESVTMPQKRILQML